MVEVMRMVFYLKYCFQITIQSCGYDRSTVAADVFLYSRYLDVNYSDTLLTLSTCYEDDRLVLYARRQRKDESASDVQHAKLGLYPR